MVTRVFNILNATIYLEDTQLFVGISLKERTHEAFCAFFYAAVV